jgi:hypothetical protein
MKWSATTNASWLTLDNPSGTNDAIINFNYSKNTDPERTGIITVTAEGALNSPKIVTITQAGNQNLIVKFIEQSKIIASDASEYDRFGRSVSISGDYAIVGAPINDDKGDESGSAYIFKRDGDSWVEQERLLVSDGDEEDWFGGSVSISGDYAIVGAYEDNDKGAYSGSAYIFKREGNFWVEQIKLLASDGEEQNYFGTSVSISGNYAIVGAYGNDDNGLRFRSGSAYIFKREGDSWIEQDKLIASDGDEEDWFGYSVSISGNYVIVGAFKDDDKGAYSGSAYIFKRDGNSWVEQIKLLASDGDEFDYFGVSVSISRNYAIVGADGNVDDNASDSGTAYIFMREGDSWVEQEKLLPSDGDVDDYFGRSVSISGVYAIVGADDYGSGSGSAYIQSIILFTT